MKGDFTPGKTIRIKFNTHKADGTPITLAGTVVVSVYKAGSTAESTAGVTPTIDYDGRTGLHVVVIDTSADGTFYAAGNDFDAVITTGTVDGVSVVGTVVGSFSLSNRSALRPATVDRTIAVDASGRVDLVDAPNATAITAFVTAVWSALTAGLNVVGSIGKLISDNLNAAITSRAAPGAQMDLVNAPNATALTAIGAKVEAMVFDEGDATALLAAIAAKVEAFLINDGDAAATLAAIAAAVNAAITTAHGDGSYLRNTEPLDAAGVRDAIGLQAANLDEQLADLPEDTAAAILETPANKLATNADGSVNAAVTVDEAAIAEAVATAVVEALAESGVAIDAESQAEIVSAVVSSLGAGRVTLLSPVDQRAKTVKLVEGDDYYAADNNSISFDITCGETDDWTDAAVWLRLQTPTAAKNVQGVIDDYDGEERQVHFDVASSVMTSLGPCSAEEEGAFQVAVVLANGHKHTHQPNGKLIVTRKVGE